MKKSVMCKTIRAQLSSDTYATAVGITLNGTCSHLTVRSPSPVLALCRKLIEVSTYAPETSLDAYRGNTLCISVSGIGEGAGLTVASAGNGCPVLRCNRPVR
jgi:hypothetical protein